MNKLLQLGIFSILLLVPAGSQNVLAGVVPVCVTPPSGMISWWPGDGNANDIVDANDGIPENGAFFAAGKVGSGFGFDGTDDQVRVPHNANQNPGGQMTVDAWINPDLIGDGAQPIINKRGAGNINAGGFTFETTGIFGLQFAFATPDGIFSLNTGSFVLTEDVFQHVAATYDGATMRIYVNGAVVASQPATGTILSTSADLVIGRNSVQPASVFDGIIDEVEFFNRGLSTSEIQAIYNADSAGKCKTPNEPPRVIGGEIIPIESTALLLAGVQTNAIWMLPAFAGIATGAYFVRTRMNKE